jgi:hypothetical protein
MTSPRSLPRRRCLLALAAVMALRARPVAAAARYDGPLFDGHLHLNWENGFRFPVTEAFALMRANGVRTILATSRPNDGTHALVAGAEASVRVVPFLRPYRVRDDVARWFDDPSVPAFIEQEFGRGYYVGLGEFHLSGAAAATAVVQRCVQFARRHSLWLHAHVDDTALEILYQHDAGARVIWAHTGFSTPAEKVGAYLRRHRDLVCELSYRSGITADGGALMLEWRRLFEMFPERFVIGSDTWVPQRWQVYGDLMESYRAWLGQLSGTVADRIAHGNGERLFPPRR